MNVHHRANKNPLAVRRVGSRVFGVGWIPAGYYRIPGSDTV